MITTLIKNLIIYIFNIFECVVVVFALVVYCIFSVQLFMHFFVFSIYCTWFMLIINTIFFIFCMQQTINFFKKVNVEELDLNSNLYNFNVYCIRYCLFGTIILFMMPLYFVIIFYYANKEWMNKCLLVLFIIIFWIILIFSFIYEIYFLSTIAIIILLILFLMLLMLYFNNEKIYIYLEKNQFMISFIISCILYFINNDIINSISEFLEKIPPFF